MAQETEAKRRRHHRSTAMASRLGLLAKPDPPSPTKITDIGDDLLREIFLRLPSLPSLVRAAIACRTFLHAVRSSLAFRRRFQAKHPPQLLGFFNKPGGDEMPTFVPLRSRSDPDLTAAFRGADFFLTRLPEDSCNLSIEWDLESCHGGYIVLVNYTTNQIAAYNPVTQALDIFPMPSEQICLAQRLEFHIVISEEDQGVFRMVGVKHQQRSKTHQRYRYRHVPACIAVFSSATREWKSLAWVETPMPPEQPALDDYVHYGGTQLNGLVYWNHASQAYVLVLDTVTLQFSRVDLLPDFAREIGSKRCSLGHTKDGKLCAVGKNGSSKKGMLFVWLRSTDDEGFVGWMLEKRIPLSILIDEDDDDDDERVFVEAVINGFVYLSVEYDAHTQSFLSLCLETTSSHVIYMKT